MREFQFPVIVLLTVMSSARAADKPGRYDPPMALVGATIHQADVAAIENATVVIENGSIVAVGPNLDPPEGALRLDATGLHVYPGFIDAHSYLGIAKAERTEDERKRLEDENPDPREAPLSSTRAANRRGIHPQRRARDDYLVTDESIGSHHRLGFATVLAAPRSGILSGFGSLINVTDAPLRRAVVASDVTQHASFSTGEPGDYPATLLGVIASLRQFSHDVKWHMDTATYLQSHPGGDVRLPVDPALDAMSGAVRDGVPIVFEANSEQEILRALRLSRELGFRVIISGGREAYKVIDALKDADAAVLVSLKFEPEPDYGKKKPAKRAAKDDAVDAETEPDEQSDADADPDAVSANPDKKAKKLYEPVKVLADKRRDWNEHVDNLRTLLEADIPAAVCSYDLDKPNELTKNLRAAIERGLSAEQALTALTVHPARILAMQDRLGAVQPGYLANLTITDAPFETKKAKVKWMIVDGKRFILESDDTDAKDSDSNGEKQSDENAPDDAESVADDSSDESTTPDAPEFAAEIEDDRKPKTRTGGNVLIRGGTIITITGDTIEDGSVLIRDGRIESVGRGLIPPMDVEVIDATGKYLMPGMIDCHSHMAIDAVNEAALSISAEVRIADVIDHRQVQIYRALAGGVTTIHTMHGSANPIGGQNVVLKLRYGASPDAMIFREAPRTIKFALGENVTQTNWQEARGKRFPNSRMGVESVLRQALIAADAYRSQRKEHAEAVSMGRSVPPFRSDLRLDALADILDGDLWVHCHGYRADEYLRLIDVAENFGFRVGVLQHILEGYRIAPEIARHGCGASTFSNDWAYKLEAYDAIAHNAAFMTRHGINVSVNSDSANTIRFMNVEAAKSVRWGGLDEIESLRLVTINPAMQLGIADRVGSIEPGKDGDIGIFNGHPLDSFSKCVMTLVDGEVYFEHPSPERVAPAEPIAAIKPAPQKIATIQKGDAYAIVNATIHPISGDVIERGTIVMRDGLIKAVGPGIAPPSDAVVIDAAGSHVYPGLIDAGGILGLSEILMLAQTRDHGDIATIEPELWTGSAINPFSAHIRVSRAAGITTAVTVPTRGTIAGRDTIIDLDGWTMTQMKRSERIALHMRAPSLPSDLPDDPETKKEITDTHREESEKLAEFMERAKLYANQRAAGADLPRDLRMEAMMPFVRGDVPVVFRAGDYKHILDTLEFAEKHDLKCAILGGREAWKCADLLAEKNVPVIISTVISYPSDKYEPFDSVFANAAMLDKAGVRYCFATGSAAEAFNLPIHVGMAVAHGLPVDRAERAVTLGAAEILGIDDQVGSLEVGRVANVIVCSDSPIQVTSGVTHMFIRGEPVELTNIQTENRDQFQDRPTPELPPKQDLVGPPPLTRNKKVSG